MKPTFRYLMTVFPATVSIRCLGFTTTFFCVGRRAIT